MKDFLILQRISADKPVGKELESFTTGQIVVLKRIFFSPEVRSPVAQW